MSFAEVILDGRDFETMKAPISVYCFVCNVVMKKGTLVKKYDDATYTHETCNNFPLKTYAPHKYKR